MTILYNNTDITDDVRVTRVEYECFLGEHADRLLIGIDSTDDATLGWGFEAGDTIKLKDPDTGKMIVYRTEYDNGETLIYAAAIHQPEERKTCSWKKIGFKDLMRTLAGGLGYGVEFYGVEDAVYDKVKQEDVDDLSFLVYRASLEGCIIVAFDGKIKVLSEDWIDEQKPKDILLDEGTFRTKDLSCFGKCLVSDGETKASHSDGDGPTMTVKVDKLSSIDEARRFAKNLLYHANRQRKIATIYVDDLLTELYAGDIVQVDCGEWREVPAVITRVRHDLEKETTKLWLRRID